LRCCTKDASQEHIVVVRIRLGLGQALVSVMGDPVMSGVGNTACPGWENEIEVQVFFWCRG
jgi:hypothetical protein